MRYRALLMILLMPVAATLAAQERVTNYEHGKFYVEDAFAIEISMRAVDDPYLRCYTAWIEDGAGGWINLDGEDCAPEEWKGSHCACPTVADSKVVLSDLIPVTRIPYTGTVIVAVSSYVGYWSVRVNAVDSAAVASGPGPG